MASYREFIIACVDRIPSHEKGMLFFDYQVQNEVTGILWQYLTMLAELRPGGQGFIPAPGWYFKPADLRAQSFGRSPPAFT